MTIDQNRQPAGVPVGGQFASASHGEPAIVLPVLPAPTDEDVMDQIALMLGTVDQWDGSADYLEEAADLIAASGRPHPGDADPVKYRQGIKALREARGRESTATETQLDNLALMLGTNREWDGPDYLEYMADSVERSGRPHPGGSIDPGEYLVRIVEGKAARAGSPEERRAFLTDGVTSYLSDGDEGVPGLQAWSVAAVRGEDGSWRCTREVTVTTRFSEELTVDLHGTPAERLLDAMPATWGSVKPGPIGGEE